MRSSRSRSRAPPQRDRDGNHSVWPAKVKERRKTSHGGESGINSLTILSIAPDATRYGLERSLETDGNAYLADTTTTTDLFQYQI